MQLNFTCKNSFPNSDRQRLVVENIVIALLPNASCCDHKDIHEERKRTCSLFYQHLENAALEVPLNIELEQPSDTRRTQRKDA